MMDRLDVYSDVICPWCFIGKQHMQRALPMVEGEPFSIAWRPFQLNPDMPPGGLPRAEYRMQKFGSLERSRELDAQVASAARAAGIEINHDRMMRTPNTVDAHRLIRWAGEAGCQDAVVDRLFQDYFVDGRDIGDPAVLTDAGVACGMDRAGTAAYLASDAGRAEVLEEDASVRRAGLSGVPTFALNDHVLFAGAVPAETFAEALAKARRVMRYRASEITAS